MSSSSSSSKSINTINPSTGKVIATYNNASDKEISGKVNGTKMAFESWQKKSIAERSEYLRNLGKVLVKKKDEYSKLITEEMGKPIRQSKAEIEKCRWACNYYADHTGSFLTDEIVPTEFHKSFVSFEPLGVIAAIMPWNFPFWQVMRFAVPAVAAGNAIILKHSSKTIGCSIKIQEAFEDAGFPENVFTSVIGDRTVGESLVRSDIDAVSITGSVKAGKRVGELASKDLKRFVLELGGSDPFVVFEDADIDRVAQMAVKSRFINTGQSCIAAKRFIVVKEIADEFTKLFVENAENEVVGDPMNSKTTIGPLVSKGARDAVADQVDDAKTKGSDVLAGGKIKDREGYFYEPTILSKVKHDMDILAKETFGPVAPVIVVDSPDEAIQEANNTEFGLGASIWTGDIEQGLNAARLIKSGIVSINDMVKSDPRMPFGGIKNSGIGRELSHYGIKEFVNIKSIMVKDPSIPEIPVE
jgi:acyl-CoA reductase-like NAD-dependent aldehyde dehydrogenase